MFPLPAVAMRVDQVSLQRLQTAVSNGMRFRELMHG